MDHLITPEETEEWKKGTILDKQPIRSLPRDPYQNQYNLDVIHHGDCQKIKARQKTHQAWLASLPPEERLAFQQKIAARTKELYEIIDKYAPNFEREDKK